VSATWTDEQWEVGKNAAVVAFASPSATEIWTERMGTQHAAACIGETSADACKKAGFSQIFFPQSPGLDGWADSVEEALAATKAVARK
jgi:uroporphyrinogen-III synthase